MQDSKQKTFREKFFEVAVEKSIMIGEERVLTYEALDFLESFVENQFQSAIDTAVREREEEIILSIQQNFQLMLETYKGKLPWIFFDATGTATEDEKNLSIYREALNELSKVVRSQKFK